jgi:hypothetical protein
MNRLRLIKPWHLQPIQQRLDAIRNEELKLISTIPCSGPAGHVPEQNTVRNEQHTNAIKKPNNAPVSDVIFASVCNNNIR